MQLVPRPSHRLTFWALGSAIAHGLVGLVLATSLPHVPQHPRAGTETLSVEFDAAISSPQQKLLRKTPKTAHKLATPSVQTSAPDMPDTLATTDSPEPSESTTNSPVTTQQPPSAVVDASSPSSSLQNAGTSISPQQQIQDRLAALLARYFQYPWIARLRGWQGDVRLAFRVAPDGEIQQIHVARSSGFAVLDKSALDSLTRVTRLSDVAEWLNGQPLDMQLAIVYRLTD